MLRSHRSDFAGATWEPYATDHAWDSEVNPQVYIRFQDYPGNISPIYFPDAWKLYVPLIGE